MASSELLDLNGGVGLTSTEVASAQGLYVVDATGNSRFVSFANLKTAINTSPTVIPSSYPYRGASLSRSSNLSIANNTSVNVSWSAAGRDTDSFWSAGAPTRLTIPSGVTKVQIGLGFRFASAATGVRIGSMLKNGAAFQGAGRVSLNAVTTADEYGAVIWSDVIDVVATDYFELSVFQTSGGALNLLTHVQTWAALKVIEVAP